MRLRLCGVVLLLAVGCSAAAFGDTTSGSGGGFSGSGTLVTTSNGDGSYTIVGISGTGITGLYDPGTFNGNDNQLYPSDASVVDGSGFSFGDAQGDTSFDVNIFSSSPGDYSAYLVDSDEFSETIPVTLSVVDPPAPPGYVYYSFAIGPVSPTPEPPSLLLFSSGLMGICGLAMRKLREP